MCVFPFQTLSISNPAFLLLHSLETQLEPVSGVFGGTRHQFIKEQPLALELIMLGEINADRCRRSENIDLITFFA